MLFEYDENKSQINQSKHGIDFNDAQLLWDDPDLVEIPAKKTGNENIRIISVRRSRIEEVNFYES